MSMNNDNTGMKEPESGQTSGRQQTPGYHTPGQDSIMQSSSDALTAPSRSGEQRLEDPPSAINSISETPGDSNPALAETIGVEQGTTSTADLLLARESGEEAKMRAAGQESYEDQSTGSRPDEFRDTDRGRPNWPDNRREDPAEYMESPRADEPLLAGAPEVFDPSLKGRVDAEVDRSGTQASGAESRSGLAPVGVDAQEDKYEHREFQNAEPPSDMDLLAPGMVNLPPEDKNG